MRSSAKPMTPRPMRLFALVICSIWARGYLLTSMTLSRKCIAVWMVFLYLSQSNLPFLIMWARLIDPRLQLSNGCKGCSPQGLVLSIGPSAAVGFLRLISSMKMSPGSPTFHAFAMMRSSISLALIFLVFCLVWGLMRSISLFFAQASMNSSVAATETLKFCRRFSLVFALMKSRMSGWVQWRMPMFAPRRLLPCLMISVVMSKTRMKLTGPEATPLVLLTMSPRGLKCENEKPVPPPLWCTIAAHLRQSKISGRESPTGRTKHALSCPRLVPAFMRVGVFGRKSSLDKSS